MNKERKDGRGFLSASTNAAIIIDTLKIRGEGKRWCEGDICEGTVKEEGKLDHQKKWVSFL